ncbi:unnamed protein product [Gongylonema pulchrum]|uniref:G_PROTEIN_RECEP_F1_2 domain-containing protein n=1 Tax=Gongylonema pulchrum TaxID=637853 RepID=A0A183DWU7_9BILA|nr:unnamed protein product [Gongylonema pulchrum]
MPRSVCYRSIFLYSLSFDMACTAILFLAIDRFVAVWSPVRYRTIGIKRFIVAAVASGLAYSTPIVFISFVTADDKLIEPCIPSLASAPQLRMIRNYVYISITLLVVVLNAISYLLIYRSKKKHETSEYGAAHRMHVIKSMLVLMTIYATTMFASSSTLFIINFLSFSKETIADITSFMSILVVINYGYTYYVLLWRCRDYRKAFLSQLHLYGSSRISVTTVKETRIDKNMSPIRLPSVNYI